MPGEKEGVNEGLGEGAYGRVRGENVGREEMEGRAARLVRCHGGNRPEDCAETVKVSSRTQMRDNQQPTCQCVFEA